MQYNNKLVRRQDRLLDKPAALQLLETGEYGVLSLQAEQGGGYGIPINYVWDGRHYIYLHCAPEGRKLRCIRLDNRVCFCIVGKTHVLPGKFTTEYKSIVLQCIAGTHLSDPEKMEALRLFLDKYSPDDKIIGMKYAEKSFHRTEIIRLDILGISGKCKQVNV